MNKIESLKDFYQRKFNWMPGNLGNEIGHFNVFQLDPYVGQGAQPVPYKRRDFYKIMLVLGQGRVHYADRVFEVKKQALTFSNPWIPYKWENTDQIDSGVFCIFNAYFFHQYGDLNQYSVFQPTGEHLFELSDDQVRTVTSIYDRMFVEMDSDYIHKYDVVRNLVFDIIHFVMKMQPSATFERQSNNAAQRISMLFTELLERQFPIEENHPQLQIRSAADFARQLNIHVNHLNRAVRETIGQTTTQVIAARILHEAKVLLRHSTWNISEVAYALGFSEVTHFNNFFKKHTEMSPTQFRQSY